MFNYKLKRLKVWWNKKFHPQPLLSETEQLAKKVVIRLLSKPKTTYFMTPEYKYYIQTEDKEFTILLGDGYLKITNHKYVYEVLVKPEVATELIMLVRKAIERSSNRMESEIFSNEKNMLSEILSKTDNGKEDQKESTNTK